MAAAAATAVAASVWRELGEVRAIAVGFGTAWLASSLSTAALMAGRAISAKAFWWAFGGGLALRLSALVGLMVLSVYHPGLSQAALLLAYTLGVLCLLLLEYRHIKLK